MEMKRDFYTLVQLSENIYFDNDGFLICKNAILGKSGTQAYSGKELGLNDNSVILIHRPEDEVFRESSLETLHGKSLTLYHPDEDVTLENYKDLSKGVVLNVRRDGNLIRGDIRITDKEVIDLITSKKMIELSLGYTTKLESLGENKMVQKEILYNHVALVPKGRAEIARIIDGQTTRILDRQFEEGELMEKENQSLLSKVLGALGLKKVKGEKDGIELYELSLNDEASTEETQENTDTENVEIKEIATEGEEEQNEELDVSVSDNENLDTKEEAIEDDDVDEDVENEENVEEVTVKDTDQNETEENNEEGETEMDKFDEFLQKAQKLGDIQDEDLRKAIKDGLLKELVGVTPEVEIKDEDNSALLDFQKLSFKDADVERYDANKEIQAMYDALNPHNPEYNGDYSKYLQYRKKLETEASARVLQSQIDEATGGNI